MKQIDFSKLLGNAKSFFVNQSGSKSMIHLKRAGVTLLVIFLTAIALFAWFAPAENHSFYIRNGPAAGKQKIEQADLVKPGAMDELFRKGREQMDLEQSELIKKSKTKVALRFKASQIVGENLDTRKIRVGSKLIGVLTNTIDTRSSSEARVSLPRGGEVDGIEIERGSVLSGSVLYTGEGDQIQLQFSRIELPNGERKTFSARALDSKTYAAGISGELYSNSGVKVAGELGLSMLAGMADVLTDKEAIGYSSNGVQPRSSMKNGLLQGVSSAAKDQTSRSSAELSATKSYIVVPRGKEMIIEVTEDTKN